MESSSEVLMGLLECLKIKTQKTSSTDVVHSPERVESPFLRQSVSKVCAALGFNLFIYLLKCHSSTELQCIICSFFLCQFSNLFLVLG